MSATKMCLVGGPCKHGNWCSDVYCQEHCRFVKEIEQLDALAELCDEAKGGWDLPPAAVSRLGALARKARAAIAAQQPQAEAAKSAALLARVCDFECEQAEAVPLDMGVMELAESVGLIGPASRTDDFHAAIQRFHDLISMNVSIKAAVHFAQGLPKKGGAA